MCCTWSARTLRSTRWTLATSPSASGPTCSLWRMTKPCPSRPRRTWTIRCVLPLYEEVPGHESALYKSWALKCFRLEFLKVTQGPQWTSQLRDISHGPTLLDSISWSEIRVSSVVLGDGPEHSLHSTNSLARKNTLFFFSWVSHSACSTRNPNNYFLKWKLLLLQSNFKKLKKNVYLKKNIE